MLDKIEVLCHACIKFNREKVIYFDPFKLNREYNDADYIFITHSHYDHYSKEDIAKIKKEDTKIIATGDIFDKLKNDFDESNIIIVEPGKKYGLSDFIFETVSAYNKNKMFHPKKNGWVGYVIELNGVRYYIAGDTDVTEENKNVRCDVAFVPIGGKFTMNYVEAAKLVNIIKPTIAVPIHYGSIVGTKDDAYNFLKLLDDKIDGTLLLKI